MKLFWCAEKWVSKSFGGFVFPSRVKNQSGLFWKLLLGQLLDNNCARAGIEPFLKALCLSLLFNQVPIKERDALVPRSLPRDSRGAHPETPPWPAKLGKSKIWCWASINKQVWVALFSKDMLKKNKFIYQWHSALQSKIYLIINWWEKHLKHFCPLQTKTVHLLKEKSLNNLC